MIDLHLHLDGSMSPGLAARLWAEQGNSHNGNNGHNFEKLLKAPANVESLQDYLKCFELPVSILQNAEALFETAYELGSRLSSQGILYAEIRFAPLLHTKEGLAQHQAVEAVRNGLDRAHKAHNAFSSQIILCCMRGAGEGENRKTIDTAYRYLGDGVCGADLAGGEAQYPAEDYRELFRYAKGLQLPFTFHAGEAAGPENIWAAISFGADRIGHGVRAMEDPRLLTVLADRGIPLELCFTSNLQTRAISGPEAFPIRTYIQKEICATVNTDNMTVSETTIWNEYRKLKELGLTDDERAVLLKNATEAAFLSRADKQRLWEKVRYRLSEMQAEVIKE